MLPSDFGEYRFWLSGEKINEEEVLDTKSRKYEFPAFMNCKIVNGTVWFIPFFSNMIIYIDKTDKSIKELHIKEEVENSLSLRKRVLNHKYLVQYIRDDRWMGLYSVKNEWVVEIDTVTKDYRILDMYPDENTLSYLKGKYKDTIAYECNEYKVDDFVDEFGCPNNKFVAQILGRV